MRKVVVLLFVLCLMLPSAQAAAPVSIEHRGIVGGYSVDLSNITALVSAGGTIADAPQVVEVYTASWCENCVPAEHALFAAIDGEDAIVLANHRNIGEAEDPLGSEAGDQRWISLYGAASKEAVGIERAPPTMVFDGSRLKGGSTPHGDSLEADYAAMFADVGPQKSHADWTSSFDYVGSNASGVVNWSFSGDSNLAWTHRLMVVEAGAHFPEGSNGLEDYEHVVREVINLNGDTGTMSIDLPTAWDGDDLSLVLIHEWSLGPEIIVDPPQEKGILPGFLVPLGLFALGAAAVASRD